MAGVLNLFQKITDFFIKIVNKNDKNWVTPDLH